MVSIIPEGVILNANGFSTACAERRLVSDKANVTKAILFVVIFGSPFLSRAALGCKASAGSGRPCWARLGLPRGPLVLGLPTGLAGLCRRRKTRSRAGPRNPQQFQSHNHAEPRFRLIPGNPGTVVPGIETLVAVANISKKAPCQPLDYLRQAAMRLGQTRRKASRPCTICGLYFRPVRLDARVCSDTCSKRKTRGVPELAYLAALPPDQLREHQRIHQAVADAIEIGRWASSARREGRAARRHLPKVKRISVRHSS